MSLHQTKRLISHEFPELLPIEDNVGFDLNYYVSMKTIEVTILWCIVANKRKWVSGGEREREREDRQKKIG